MTDEIVKRLDKIIALLVIMIEGKEQPCEHQNTELLRGTMGSPPRRKCRDCGEEIDNG